MHQQTGCLTGKRSIPAPYGTLHRWLEVLDFVLDRRRDERLKMRGIKRSVYHRTQAFAKEVLCDLLPELQKGRRHASRIPFGKPGSPSMLFNQILAKMIKNQNIKI